MNKYICSLCISSLIISFSQRIIGQNLSRNILLIVVDDLRPRLGCYGSKEIITPNIDKIAEGGVLFERAYCQIASCGPSRASFLTSRWPDQTQIFDNQPYVRDHLPDIITLPQLFKNHGYKTLSFGKIFHGIFENEVRDDPESWSEMPWRPKVAQYFTETGLEILKKDHKDYIDEVGNIFDAMTKRRLKGLVWESPDIPDSMFADGMTANKAIASIGAWDEDEGPFFIGVGFVKPHLPFVAPKKYFDLYSGYGVNNIEDGELPENLVSLSHNDSRELRGYKGVPKEGNISMNTALEVTKAYNACVSFIDAQIGKVINQLERMDALENTIIVILGDHGYHLNDLGLWCKNTNFESGLRVPLIISTPETRSQGYKSDELVELLDLMPTLCDLTGLPIPEGVKGESLAPVFNDSTFQLKEYAISQGPRPYFGRDKGSYMGYSIRSDRFRYTEWLPKDKSKPIFRELYDFNKYDKECINIADDPEYANIIQEMSSTMYQKLSN